MAIKKLKKLKKLKLNKNFLSEENLMKLDNIINSTTIEELEMNQISLPFDNLEMEKSSIYLEKNNFSMFYRLFSQSKNLKSLSIQLNSK